MDVEAHASYGMGRESLHVPHPTSDAPYPEGPKVIVRAPKALSGGLGHLKVGRFASDHPREGPYLGVLMGDQQPGTRPARSNQADQSAVLRKLAGRLDDLTTGEVARLIRPGDEGYGTGPGMPVIDPDAYRAETGKEWVPPTGMPTAPAAAAPAPEKQKAAPAQPKPAAAKAGAGAKPRPQAKAGQGARPQGKPKQQAGRPAPPTQQKAGAGKPRPPAQAGSANAGAKPRPPAKQQAGAAHGAAPKQGFFARLWAKLTGR